MGRLAAGGMAWDGGVPMTPLVKRIVSAVVALPVFVAVVAVAPSWLFRALVVVVSAAAMLELVRMLEHAGRPTYRRLGTVAAAAVAASFAFPGAMPVVLAVSVAAILSAPVWSGAPPASEPAGHTLLGVLWIGFMLGHAILLHARPDGPALVLFAAGVTWVGESAAYLVGSALGRRKLAPHISPGKTVEGAAAQVAASVIAAAALAGWLLPGCGLTTAMAAGALLGVVGQVGDLAESVMKRSAGTKDTGGVMPGHGGILDRIDSLLFNVPAFFYFVSLAGCR